MARRLLGDCVQRFFELPNSASPSSGVGVGEGTTFPGHEKDDKNPHFLTSEGKANRVLRTDLPDLAVADDGRMAMELLAVNGTREAEAFFAEPAIVLASNAQLQLTRSAVKLKVIEQEGIVVPDLSGGHHRLQKVVGEAGRRTDESTLAAGPDLTSAERCNEVAKSITGGPLGVAFLREIVDVDPDALAEALPLFLAAYLRSQLEGKSQDRRDHISAATEAAKKGLGVEAIKKTGFETRVTIYCHPSNTSAVDSAVSDMASRGDALLEPRKSIGSPWTRRSKSEASCFFIVRGQREKARAYLERLIARDLDPHIDRYEIRTSRESRGVDDAATQRLVDERIGSILREEIGTHPQLLEAAEREIGINAYAAPDVGQAYMIAHLISPDNDRDSFPYHFAAVIARSGVDTVTFENYWRGAGAAARARDGERRMYFQMYGPRRNVDIGNDGPRRTPLRSIESPDQREAEEYASGSFHGRWASLFKEPATVAVGKQQTWES